MPQSDPPTGGPAAKRKPPWSVFIVAGIFFAIGLWLYLDVRREVKEAEEAAKRAPVVASAKPKILGLDIIPQLAESNEARLRPPPSASASGAPSTALSAAAPPPSAGPSASAARPAASSR